MLFVTALAAIIQVGIILAILINAVPHGQGLQSPASSARRKAQGHALYIGHYVVLITICVGWCAMMR